MAIEDVPECLKVRRQWIVFDIHKLPTGEISKLPRIPNEWGRPSVDDPTTWRTFEDAISDGAHPTFVLTDYDPFVFLDLDALKRKPKETDREFSVRQELHGKICDALTDTFQSYQELSVSGKGVHIIMRGRLRGPGIKRGGVELYDRGRFVIFTGNRINEFGVVEAPPQELEDLEMFLRQDTPVTRTVPLSDGKEVDEDAAIINVLCQTPRYRLLWEGRRSEAGDYLSPSEADFDFIAELYRKSPSVSQIKRIFQSSGLYRPNKVWDYVERALVRLQGEKANTARIAESFAAFRAPTINGQPHPSLPAPEEPKKPKLRKEGDVPTLKYLADNIPQGMLQKLHKAYLEWSFMPHSEGSLVAALTSAMLLFSRGYQTSTGLALKQYMILLALTSSGKDIITKGPNEMLARIGVPSADKMWRGKPRSEQGLFRILSETPRMVSYLGECGRFMRDMCDEKGPSFDQNLREALTTAWSASDDNGCMSPSEKSEASKLGVIHRPCITMLGDSQPSTFYGMIDSSHALTGWLPRFVIVEAPPSSMSEYANKKRLPLPESLVDEYKSVFTQMQMRDQTGQHTQVPMTDEAESLIDDYELRVRRKIIAAGAEDDRLAQLINRNGAKVRVFSALLAVCDNWHEPLCTVAHMEWAMAFVERTSQDMRNRMLSGEYDASVAQQRPSLEHAIQFLMDMPAVLRRTSSWKRYFTSHTLQSTPWYIPLSALRAKAVSLAPFKSTPPYVLDGHIKDMVRDGRLFVLEKNEAWEQAYCRGTLVCVATDEYWDQQETNEPPIE